MNILIFEYITGGGLANQALPAGLVKEGEMMLRAVANDFAQISVDQIPNVQVNILKDYRLTIRIDAVKEISVTPEISSIHVIEEMADELDAVLVIAPETDNILASLCERFEKLSFTLLNSSTDSIKLTADKYTTYNHLARYAFAQIPSYTCNEVNNLQKENNAEKFIIKSRDGVGCEDLVIFDSLDDVKEAITGLEKDKYIVQPYVEGKAASLSLLCWNGDCLLLTVNEQILEAKNGSLNLVQCRVNILAKEEFSSFAKQLIEIIPGLQGYIGVDIVVKDNEIFLVEINPRLTTSYAGIGTSIGINPAALMLDCFMHKKLPILNTTCNEIFDLTFEAEYAA